MIDPVALPDFFITFFSAAAIVVFGAGYAALFAWARLAARPFLLPWAYGCYAVLAVAVFLLAGAAHLRGSWAIVTALMLVGYLLAPHAIWHLCSATHHAEDSDCSEGRTGPPISKTPQIFNARARKP